MGYRILMLGNYKSELASRDRFADDLNVFVPNHEIATHPSRWLRNLGLTVPHRFRTHGSDQTAHFGKRRELHHTE